MDRPDIAGIEGQNTEQLVVRPNYRSGASQKNVTDLIAYIRELEAHIVDVDKAIRGE